ncbi:MAG: adenosylcobinamide-GDP ribazoletransferase [Lachnospiraceae bacterium]|nr:adenosylcobinamide-GDP ribazoletransferase [Lachnospiraceae bacterium]
MRQIFRWMAFSLSLYSKIPMPRFPWEEKDRKGSLLFFPLVGILLALLMYGADWLLVLAGAPVFVRAVVLTILPIALTGGFHLDGYMDTTDALCSYAEREKKLEILKDPHCGAFAVIGLVKTVLLLAAAMYVIAGAGALRYSLVPGGIFVLSRCFCAVISLRIKKAKTDGMLCEETKGAGKGILTGVWAFLLLSVAVMLVQDFWHGLLILGTYVLSALFYRRKMLKEFGGVTGDTAGWFVVCAETFSCAVYAASLLVQPLFAG